MTREIFLAYNLVEDKLDIKPIGNGLINTTWLVSNGKSDFILQKINTDVFKHPESIAKNIRLLANYLHKNHPGYLFAVPLKTIDSKEMVHTDNNEYFRLTPYIKDSCTINTVAKPRQAYQAARQFGKFTRLLSQFPVEKLQITLPDFHNLILRYSQFEEALKKIDEFEKLMRKRKSNFYDQFIYLNRATLLFEINKFNGYSKYFMGR